MSTLSKLARLMPSTLHFQKSTIPALRIDGTISPETTIDITALLERIPKNKDKIAVLINSQGGCYAQAHIISQKIAQIAKRNRAEVWTFAQEWALNAGFMLLSSGDRVFVDRASVVGGLEVGQAKFLRGQIGQYISTVTYAEQPSYLSERNKPQPFDAVKKEEILAVNRLISQDVQVRIRNQRSGRLEKAVDLNGFYFGEEAVRVGLADGMETHHSAFSKQQLNADVRVLQNGSMQKLIHAVRRCNISD